MFAVVVPDLLLVPQLHLGWRENESFEIKIKGFGEPSGGPTPHTSEYYPASLAFALHSQRSRHCNVGFTCIISFTLHTISQLDRMGSTPFY